MSKLSTSFPSAALDFSENLFGKKGTGT